MKTFKTPKELKYTEDHEWCRRDGARVTIGVTDYAQDALTDVVFVELPEVGESFEAGESMGVVESVKSVNDIFAPVGGTVVEVNEALNDNPELVNEDAYGKGWMVVLEMKDPKEIDALLDAAAYEKTTAEH